MRPKLSHATVAKAVKCDVRRVKYWLRRWKQSRDLSDSIRSGRVRATTPKQDEQIVSLAEQQTFVTARNIANKLRKTGATVNEGATILQRLNEAGTKYYNQPLPNPLRLPKCTAKIV